MGIKIDLTGQKFGRLTVIEATHKRSKGSIMWSCRCECGNLTTVRSSSLRNSHTASCGCLAQESRSASGKENIKAAHILNTIHGHTLHTQGKSSTYQSWVAMKHRYLNPNAVAYALYGGAGVKIALEWMTFEGFLNSMGVRPGGTTLGRILDMGDYVRSNCEWQTPAQQGLAARNKRALLGRAA